MQCPHGHVDVNSKLHFTWSLQLQPCSDLGLGPIGLMQSQMVAYVDGQC